MKTNRAWNLVSRKLCKVYSHIILCKVINHGVSHCHCQRHKISIFSNMTILSYSGISVCVCVCSHLAQSSATLLWKEYRVMYFQRDLQLRKVTKDCIMFETGISSQFLSKKKTNPWFEDRILSKGILWVRYPFVTIVCSLKCWCMWANFTKGERFDWLAHNITKKHYYEVGLFGVCSIFSKRNRSWLYVCNMLQGLFR